VKIRLAYDHQIFSGLEYGGISRYFYELAVRLARLEKFEVTVLSPLYVNKYLRPEPPLRVVGVRFPRIPRTGRIVRRIDAGLVRFLLKRQKPDIVHETFFAPKKLAPPSARTILSVFDMVHEKFPHFCSRRDRTARVKRAAVERADHIICISENTRRDLLGMLSPEPSRVSVVHLGYTIGEAPAGEFRPVPEPYLAFVGLRGGYKNFAGLLRAYAASTLLKSSFRIVCFGGGPWTKPELRLIEELRIPRERVVRIDGDDDRLAALYRHAEAFIYPSLYEGFGMPLLEAMACGCPVICSRASAFPEVCGDAAAYFDPGDSESIRSVLERTLMSRESLISLAARGRERINRFSWDQCAAATAAVYEAIL